MDSPTESGLAPQRQANRDRVTTFSADPGRLDKLVRRAVSGACIPAPEVDSMLVRPLAGLHFTQSTLSAVAKTGLPF